MNFYEEALALKDECIAHRRYLHSHPEVGMDLPDTKAYVKKQLQEMGITPADCGYGVTALIGKGAACRGDFNEDNCGKVLLLRADMDALPIQEENDCEYASRNPGCMHACGHDLHTAMLLMAAKLLKSHENELKGTVKLMFQPAEEVTRGAQHMIDEGILKNPAVDAALGYHVWAGKSLPGIFQYNSVTPIMASVDMLQIDIIGKGGHGAYPNNCIDPINIGVHIFTALEALIARESDPEKTIILSVGSFQGGSAPNIIPDHVTMKASLRTNDRAQRAWMIRRIHEVAETTAAMYGGSASVTITAAADLLQCDHDTTEEMAGYMNELEIPGLTACSNVFSHASEDFADIASQVPSVFMFLSAGFPDERGDYPGHNPKVQFNEDVLAVGIAGFTACAMRWLEKHA